MATSEDINLAIDINSTTWLGRPEQESGRAGTLCNRNREHCRDAKS